MTGKGPACLHSEEVSVWEGLAAWEDAYEQVPESSGEPGRAGSSLSRCLAQTQHCVHPQHDRRETPEQTAVQRGAPSCQVAAGIATHTPQELLPKPPELCYHRDPRRT